MTEHLMARTDTNEHALAAARALTPQIIAKREEMEAERRIPQALVAAMKAAGMFRLSMPRAMGGPELTPMAQVQVVEALSMVDASVGWTAMLGLHAGYFTAFLDAAAARSMYADLDAFTGGVTKPTGTAVVVKGGYRVSGRWTFGSCCQHSDWLFSGCVVVEDGNPRRLPDGSSENPAVLPPRHCDRSDRHLDQHRAARHRKSRLRGDRRVRARRAHFRRVALSDPAAGAALWRSQHVSQQSGGHTTGSGTRRN
jgi:hypothetical protein